MTTGTPRIAIVYDGEIDRINASGLTTALYNNSIMFNTIPARDWVQDLYLAHEFSAVIIEVGNGMAWPLSEPMIDYLTTAPCKPVIALILAGDTWTIPVGFIDGVIDLRLEECTDTEIDAIKLCMTAVHRRSFEQRGMTAEIDNFVHEDFAADDVFEAMDNLFDTGRPARSVSPSQSGGPRIAGRRVAQWMLELRCDFG